MNDADDTPRKDVDDDGVPPMTAILAGVIVFALALGAVLAVYGVAGLIWTIVGFVWRGK